MGGKGLLSLHLLGAFPALLHILPWFPTALIPRPTLLRLASENVQVLLTSLVFPIFFSLSHGGSLVVMSVALGLPLWCQTLKLLCDLESGF